MDETVKPVEWVGSSRDDLREFPIPVRRLIGLALRMAQAGDKHPDTKPLRGYYGAGVLEVDADDNGNTYRAVDTVRFPEAVYVLHCFQKKSTRGIATSQHGRTVQEIFRRQWATFRSLSGAGHYAGVLLNR